MSPSAHIYAGNQNNAAACVVFQFSDLVQQSSKKNVGASKEMENEKETCFTKSLLCPGPCTGHFTHVSSFSTLFKVSLSALYRRHVETYRG